MTTGSLIWKWNETDASQFGGGFAMGPVTGTVTANFKPATGTFMVNPVIEFEFSEGFHTPSGSMYLIPLDIDMPKAFNIKFVATCISASAKYMETSTLFQNSGFGFLCNASTGSSDISNICGTYLSFNLSRHNANQLYPRAVNAGKLNWKETSQSGMRLQLVTSSHVHMDLYANFLSLTGSRMSGTDVSMATVAIADDQQLNENSWIGAWDYRSQYYPDFHPSGSDFAGKKLNKIYLGFVYNPPGSQMVFLGTGSILRGAKIEVDNLSIFKHPSADDREPSHPPDPVWDTVEPIAEPFATFGNALTYWADIEGATVSGSETGNVVTQLRTYNDITPVTFSSGNIGRVLRTTNEDGYPSLFFSQSAFLSASRVGGAVVRSFFSASYFHSFFVCQILTGSTNQPNAYSNHKIFGLNSSAGVYYRHRPNGSASIDFYVPSVSCSVDVKYGETVLIEYWKNSNFVYGRINNSVNYVSASAPGPISDTANDIFIGANLSNQQWHLLEMITLNQDIPNHVNYLAVSNYLSEKFNLPTRVDTVIIGGEEW